MLAHGHKGYHQIYVGTYLAKNATCEPHLASVTCKPHLTSITHKPHLTSITHKPHLTPESSPALTDHIDEVTSRVSQALTFTSSILL